MLGKQGATMYECDEVMRRRLAYSIRDRDIDLIKSPDVWLQSILFDVKD